MQHSPVPFALYVVWHPDFAAGLGIGEAIHHSLSPHGQFDGTDGSAVHVAFRNVMAPGAMVPLPIEWSDADATAVVVLMDQALAGSSEWRTYVHALIAQAEEGGWSTRVFPVAMESGILRSMELDAQAMRWCDWAEQNRSQRLHQALKHEFAKMLRYRLSRFQGSDIGGQQYKDPINVFLSYSNHDKCGASVAQAIRDWLHEHSQLASFMDVHNISPGLEFQKEIMDAIRQSVVAIIYTDSYSSREWCRLEVIEAKRRNLPMLMVDCLQEYDEQAFPYLGNMPVIRMKSDRVDLVVGRLLDEVFKDLLWQCRVERLRQRHPEALYMARPPELVSLANLPKRHDGAAAAIVYPDPPMGENEVRLFKDIAPDVRLHSLTAWLAGGAPS